MAGLRLRIHDLSASHDWDQEHDCDDLENDVDEGEEKCDRANVVECFPGVRILQWLAGPDVAHHEDPQDVHHNGHDAQTNNLLTTNKQCETMQQADYRSDITGELIHRTYCWRNDLQCEQSC